MPKLLLRVLVLVLLTAAGVFVAHAVAYSAFEQFEGATGKVTAECTFEIMEVRYSGELFKRTITLPAEREPSAPEIMPMKQRAVMLTQMTSSLGEAHNFLVVYPSPDTFAGQEVERDAVIKELPRPRFWRDEYGHPSSWSKHLGCSLMLYVTLHSSGKVSDITVVSAQRSKCDKQSDVIEAAKGISFIPATQDGQPATQRQLVFYRFH